jgi:ferredoxin-type protein NapH
MSPKIYKIQLARRAVQFFVLALILVIPMIARYNNYLSARELDKVLDKWNGTLQGETLYAIDAVMRGLPGGETERGGVTARNRASALSYAQSLRGGPLSIEIGPLSMTDPLAAAESMAASRSSVRVLWIGLIVPVALALILGRVFCSWVCPVGLLFEYTDKLRRPLRWLELKPGDLRPSRATKYILLAVGLGLAALLAVPVLGYIYPPAIVGRELHDLVFGMFDRAEMRHFGFWAGGLTWMSFVILVIAVLEIAVSRRWWCRYICPGGALYSMLGWPRLVRVKRDHTKCVECGDCDEACHLGLKPMRDKMGIECDNCGLCVSNCANDAINYGIKVRK